MSSPLRYLVTGGAGFIGSHLVRSLAASGFAVRVVDDFSTPRSPSLPWASTAAPLGPVKYPAGVYKHRSIADLNAQTDQWRRGHLEGIEGGDAPLGTVEIRGCSILDPVALASSMEGVDYVVHLAAVASVPRSVADPGTTHEVNATGTLRVLEAARDAGVRRVVQASSSSVYGAGSELPVAESAVLSPQSPYAASKVAAEAYGQAFASSMKLEVTALRLFNVFGPGQDPAGPYAAVIPAFVARMRAGEHPVIFGDGKQSRDFTAVADVVGALRLGCTAPDASGRVYNVGGGVAVDLLALAAALNELLGTSLPPVHEPPRVGDVRHSLACLRAAQRDLGYLPAVSWKRALADMVEGL